MSTKLNLDNFTGLLVRLGSNDDWSPLMYTVEQENKNMTKLLLKNGADVNYKDRDGFSVLAVAIDTMDIEICKLLLEFNPIIDNPNEVLELLQSSGDSTLIQIFKDYYLTQQNKIIKKIL